MIMTQSKIGMFFRCGEQFRRRWIDGDIMPPGISARVGSGVHHGAYINHRQKIETMKDEPVSVLQDAARDKYIELIQDEGVYFPPKKTGVQKEVNDGLNSTLNMVEVYRNELAPNVQPVLAEERIEMEREGIVFSGIIDFAENDWLGDIKTTRKSFTQKQADASIQATLYRELFKERLGKHPHRISFEVFRSLKTKSDHTQIFTHRDNDAFRHLIRRVKVIFQALEAGIFPPASPETFWGCNPEYCGYWWTCPYISERQKVA